MQGSWFLLAAGRETCVRGRQGWRDLPPGAAVRFAVALAIGFALSAGVTAGLTLAAKRSAERGGLNAWDRDRLLAVERGPVSFTDAILLESFGNLAYLIPLTLLCAVLATRGRRPLLAAAFALSYGLARLLILFGWNLWDRARPDLIAGGVAAPKLHSFPSGHVVLALSVWGLIAYAWASASRSWVERGLAALVMTVPVVAAGWGRVRLGSHWPSDVLAGAAIGLVWLVAVIVALRLGERVRG